MRKAIAASMARSNREIPHYYLAADVDMSRALAWLEEENRRRSVEERLLPAALLLKAVALALREIPELNGFWEEGRTPASVPDPESTSAWPSRSAAAGSSLRRSTTPTARARAS